MIRLAASIGLGLVAASAGFAQGQTLTFEVASVKAATPGERGGRFQFLPGGRVSAVNVSLTYLIQQIYQVRDFQLVGNARWLSLIADGMNGRYYIEAKGAESATEPQMREMLKALLADRFKLKLHRETHEFPVYSVVPAKDGIRVTTSRDDGSSRFRGAIIMHLEGWMEGTGVTMPTLINTVSRFVDRPIVDQSGLKEPFDFQLAWTPTQETELSANGCPASFATFQQQRQIKAERLTCASTIFAAFQEQLGLKLEARKAPVEVLVIDHVERPSEN